MTNEVDIGSIEKNRELELLPPSDARVRSAIAPFSDDMLAEEGFKDRKELTEKMYNTMKKYGGIGLTCNQVGLPFNYFVIGGHPQVESGLTIHCFNPIIVSSSDEKVLMTEGCLTFPFVLIVSINLILLLVLIQEVHMNILYDRFICKVFYKKLKKHFWLLLSIAM